MGGTLAVTIRDPAGEEFRMLRWTNPTPYFVNCMGLVTKSPKHLSDYMKTWFDMKADWEKHRAKWEELLAKYGDKAHDARRYPFEHNMTTAYAPYPAPLAPAGYGLLVVDMLKNRILHMQGYTSYGDMDVVTASVDLGQDGEKSFWELDPEGEGSPNHAYALREFYEAGRIKRIRTRNPRTINDPRLIKIEDIHSSQELLDYLNRDRYADDTDRDNPNNWATFDIDFSPFTVERFPESLEGCKQLKAAVLDCGLVLSSEEEQEWDRYMKDRWDDDEA